uniref:(northern house mosquito) hypothetical protein n=1 Tax=Culex pipiens TaxID=7175 RepID=A0A8D8EZZ1_CULPI
MCTGQITWQLNPYQVLASLPRLEYPSTVPSGIQQRILAITLLCFMPPIHIQIAQVKLKVSLVVCSQLNRHVNDRTLSILLHDITLPVKPAQLVHSWHLIGKVVPAQTTLPTI